MKQPTIKQKQLVSELIKKCTEQGIDVKQPKNDRYAYMCFIDSCKKKLGIHINKKKEHIVTCRDCERYQTATKGCEYYELASNLCKRFIHH